ncbi:hypothetical protein K501DRAFT_268170 [Backusella circina FSU 941]|nr:hypothetical protein K501DRAFT_268170 [Backusella circina FSU 941]
MYDDKPYEDFFYRKIQKIVKGIAAAGISDSTSSPTSEEIAFYNYHDAYCRPGYWHYQQRDCKRAWGCFSKYISNRELYPCVYDVLMSKWISSKEKNEMLDQLKTQMELVDSSDDSKKRRKEAMSILPRCKNEMEHNVASEKYSFTIESEAVFKGEACYYLGIMYKGGHGTALNELKAKEYFVKAVKYGNEGAKRTTRLYVKFWKRKNNRSRSEIRVNNKAGLTALRVFVRSIKYEHLIFVVPFTLMRKSPYLTVG